jgi:hypothetical protein
MIAKAPVETGQAESTVIVEIKTEKMDKATVDGEKNQFSTIRDAPIETGKEAAAIDNKNQMERCAESDLPAGKHRLYEDYVTCVLSMPKEVPCEIPYTDNLAELMGVTEEWLEQQQQRHREAAARSELISKEFELFQDKVREEWDRQGYFEVDDEYLDGVARLQEYSEEMCKGQDRSGYKLYGPDLCEQAEGLCSVE